MLIIEDWDLHDPLYQEILIKWLKNQKVSVLIDDTCRAAFVLCIDLNAQRIADMLNADELASRLFRDIKTPPQIP